MDIAVVTALIYIFILLCLVGWSFGCRQWNSRYVGSMYDVRWYILRWYIMMLHLKCETNYYVQVQLHTTHTLNLINLRPRMAELKSWLCKTADAIAVV